MPAHRNSRYWCILCGAALTALICWHAGAKPRGLPQHASFVRAAKANAKPIESVRPIQLPSKTPLAEGKLLVASQDLGDPNFMRSVVLLIGYSEKGAMGLIVNRATDVKLAELLPRIESLKDRGDPIYEGGPVERADILMLLRSPEEPEDSRRLFDHVYLSASAGLLKRLAAESARDDESFRVYSGYAGWAPGQLEAEVELGSWHIFPATAAAIFSPRPGAIWRELIDRTTLRLALEFGSVWAPARGGAL